MITVDLDDPDKAALIALLKQEIAADPFPMSHRTTVLRAVMAKLQGQPETPTGAQAAKRPAKTKPR